MAKIKLTKGELKRHRDALWQFQRYLPTLQLKKQQLQLEINLQLAALEKKVQEEKKKRGTVESWAGLFSEETIDFRPMIKPKQIISTEKNIAGVDLPVFQRLEFGPAEYDLFLVPLWLDAVIEELRKLVSMREELKVLEKEIQILRQELRVTTQRVNLFEKIKIPEALAAIRAIKIYLGDQMTNAVGRSKIAKRKIESLELQGVAV